MSEDSDVLIRDIEAAGYVAERELVADDHEGVVCRRAPAGDDLFWVAYRRSGWYLFVVGRGFHVPDPDRVVPLCIALLDRATSHTPPEIPSDVCREFELVEWPLPRWLQERSEAEHLELVVLDEKYRGLQEAVADAGFFATGVEFVAGRDRVTCASQEAPKGRGPAGNSFWVAERSGHWYLGTWGARIYQVPDEHRVADLCIDWMRRNPDRAREELDEDIRHDYRLVQVTCDGFDGLM